MVMASRIYEVYYRACEDVVKKFERPERLEYLKNEIKLKSSMEMIEEIEKRFDEMRKNLNIIDKMLLRSFRLFLDEFKLKSKFKKMETASYLIDDEGSSYLCYPDDMVEDEIYPSLLHELGHGLYYSYKSRYDSSSSISETYAFAAENRVPKRFEVRTGKYILDGFSPARAFDRSIEESIKNGDIKIVKISNRKPAPKRVVKKYLKSYKDYQKDHFVGLFLLDEIQKEFEKDYTKILGGALVNHEIDFKDEKNFLETLKKNY